jgi:arylsulfatase A-like enzyme
MLLGAWLLVVACGRGAKGRESGIADKTPMTAMSGVQDGATPAVDGIDAGRSAAPAKVPPSDLSVLVISIDSLRADMPWAGYPRAIAPRLTELEKKSVSYTRAYSISSYTSASLSGFLAGRYPSELRRSGFFFGTYPNENLMFPEILQQKGIHTIGAHAHGYFNSAGFQQGFDVWEIVPGIVFKNETDPNVTGPQHEAIAERLLSDPKLAAPGARFFAWFHFLDPHDQYVSHEKDGIPAYGKGLRDRYDAEVTFTDVQIGKLLDFVDKQPWARRVAIIVTADHGEAFGEHKMFAHGFELWENLIRVPLFIHVPGASPKHIDEPRSTIDLAPTILELLGVAPEPTFEGKSLVGEIYGTATPEPRDVIVDLPMTSDNDKRRALVHGKEKIIAFGKEEAVRYYDLEKDPDEGSPLTRGDAVDALTKRYREASKSIKEVAPYACKEGCLNRAYANKQ